MTYPNEAGFKGHADTGRQGAIHASRDLGDRQREALDALRKRGEASADQIAEDLGRHWFHVRPRFSELKALGLVKDTGKRVSTGLGGKTVVFRPATAEETALHLARKAADAAEHGEDSQ